MEPIILPPQPHQISAIHDDGDADDDQFFTALMEMDIHLFDEELMSSLYSTVGHSLPVECNVVATGYVTAGESAGDISGGNGGGAEGSSGRVTVTSGGGGSNRLIRKAMTDETLDELFRVDPKRAKRIIDNRKSAARSKEKKLLHASQVKENVNSLQIELASIYSKIYTVVGNKTAMTAKNMDLIMKLDGIEKAKQLRYAEAEQLTIEVEQLKIENDAIPGDLPYDIMQFQYCPNQLALHQLLTPPLQYMVPQQPEFGFSMLLQPPLELPPSLPSSFSLPEFNVEGGPSYSNFNPLN